MKHLHLKVSMLIPLVLMPTFAYAIIQGVCSDCHTIHNSQNNQEMADFNGETGPNPALTRGSCLGCHAQGGGQAMVSVGSAVIPQVMHTDGTDLAGGNFAYIMGAKGSGTSDGKGHNLWELTGIDEMIPALPGGIRQSFHEDYIVNTSSLTCAGTNGCHGYRYASSAMPKGINGAHHNNVDGKLEIADSPGNSYRFLTGVKGLEDIDWQYTRSGVDHNEYTALTIPKAFGCYEAGTYSCHGGAVGIKPPDGTISQYCATCHGNFHTLATSRSDGIGATATSPFIRHPTDLALPNDGEYRHITAYNLNAPVGRTVLADTANATASAANGDAVTCLSCHLAHASDYPDMLRWDYTAIIAGGGSSSDGCFACHTTKDD